MQKGRIFLADEICEVKDREVGVWAEVFANEDVAGGLVKRNIRTG